MKKGYTMVKVLIVVIIVVAICCIPLYVSWTDSNLDYAVSWLKDKPTNVPMWLSAIFAFIFNGVGLAFNIIVTILK